MKKENIEFILKVLLPAIAVSILIYTTFIESRNINRYDVNRDGKVSTQDCSVIKAYLQKNK
jgi:hypothetical protein